MMLKAIKDGLRVLLLGLLSFLLTEGVITVLVESLGGKLDPVIKAGIVTGLTGVLKSVDKWLHESGLAERGITRF